MDVFNVLFAIIDFALSALNLYWGISGTSNNPALNFSICLFCFEIGILQTAIYLKEDK